MSTKPDDAARKPIGVLCFAGGLPFEVATEASRRGESIFAIGFRGFARPEIEQFPHAWIKLGQIGHFFSLLRREAIDRIVIVGAVTRPKLRDLSLDWRALWTLPRIARMLRAGGDDSALRRIVGYFEEQGVTVLGVADVAPDLLAQPGQLGGRAMTDEHRRDADIGLAVLDALSPFDVGQACIVLDGRPVAIEGAEGTDAMIARVADLRATGRLRVDGARGVLIKAAKRNQDLRVDLPTIGPRTIELAAQAKLGGVAIEAGKALIADRAATLALADRLGLFIAGLSR